MVPNSGRTGRVVDDGCHVRIDRSSLPGSPGDGDRSAAAGRSAPPAAVTSTSNQNHAPAIDRQLPKPQTAFAEPPEQAAAPWVSLSGSFPLAVFAPVNAPPGMQATACPMQASREPSSQEQRFRFGLKASLYRKLSIFYHHR